MIELLKTISGLWPIGIVAIIFISIIIFNNPIRKLIKNLKHLKFEKGDVRFEFNQRDDIENENGNKDPENHHDTEKKILKAFNN